MNNIITIDRDSIPNLKDWFKDNKKYINDPVPPDETTLPKDIEIDLKKFLFERGPSDWCVNNADYIVYNKSREAIEYIHTIDINGVYDDNIRELVKLQLCDFLTLEELVKKGYIFNVNKYQKGYMILEMSAANKLMDAQFGPYNRNKSCYSHPFFKSIIDNNLTIQADTTKWRFCFVLIKIDGSDTVAFLIEFNDENKTIKYYDYSQIPPASFMGLNLGDIQTQNGFSISGGNAFNIKNSLGKTRIF